MTEADKRKLVKSRISKVTSTVKIENGIATVSQPTVNRKRCTILWVDDQPDIITGHAEQLRSAGYRVYVIPNIKTLEHVLKELDEDPDLVLMDLNLGHDNLDGIRMIRKLKNDYQLNVSYVIISENALANDVSFELAKLQCNEGVCISGIIQKPMLDQYLFQLSVDIYVSNAEMVRNHPIDQLTKIPNRVGFESSIIKQLSDWLRGYVEWKKKPYNETVALNEALSILFIDIDDFSYYNNNFNHDVGDFILFDFASLIRYNLRQSDHFARHGGEEFVAFLPNTKFELAHRVFTKLANDITTHSLQNAESYKKRLTLSVGISTLTYVHYERLGFLRNLKLEDFSGDFEKLQIELKKVLTFLINSADLAMYHAKEIKNRIKKSGQVVKKGNIWRYNALNYYDPINKIVKIPSKKQ